MKMILASCSPRRKKILGELGIDFITCPADIEEITEGMYNPRIPIINSIAKASYVAGKFPNDLVLGADTIIEFMGHVIGKPDNLTHAREILTMLSGETHHVVTSVCLISRNIRVKCIFCEDTSVTFKTLDENIISSYLDKVHVLDKAGAYAIQEYGNMLIDKISGPMDNVIGLPGKKLVESIQACGLASFILKQAPSL